MASSALTGPPPAPQRSHEVARSLESAILDGRFAVGSRLPSEGVLGKQFKVSRTVIREAIRQLSSRGLVSTRVGSGTYIIAYSSDNVRSALHYYSILNAEAKTYHELFELRFMIEVECVRRLADPGQEAALARVWEQLERMRHNLDNIGPFSIADLAFHRMIVEAAGNRLFSALMDALEPLLESYGQKTRPEKSWAEKTLRDHQEIFEAIRANRSADAVAAMQKHLRESLAHFDQIEESRKNPAPYTTG